MSFNEVLQWHSSSFLHFLFISFLFFSFCLFFFLIHRHISGPGLSPLNIPVPVCDCDGCHQAGMSSSPTSSTMLLGEAPLPTLLHRNARLQKMCSCRCCPFSAYLWLAGFHNKQSNLQIFSGLFLSLRVCEQFYLLLLLLVKGNIYFAICWTHNSTQMCWRKCFLLLFREEKDLFLKKKISCPLITYLFCPDRNGMCTKWSLNILIALRTKYDLSHNICSF